MIEVNGMAHVILTVSQWDKARAFYSELLPFLGLTKVYDGNNFLYHVGGRTAVGIQREHERAFVANPDVLLVGTWPGSKQALSDHPLLSQLRAVCEGRIVALRTELLVALSQYTADAAWELAHLLHPDRVPASPGARP